MRLSKMNDDEKKKFKKQFGLPQNKDIVYYDNYEHYSKHVVSDLEIIYTYKSGCATLNVWLENGEKTELPIHSSYLKEMQNKNFLKHRLEGNDTNE